MNRTVMQSKKVSHLTKNVNLNIILFSLYYYDVTMYNPTGRGAKKGTPIKKINLLEKQKPKVDVLKVRIWEQSKTQHQLKRY